MYIMPVQINELNEFGLDLLSDSETYLNELTDDSLVDSTYLGSIYGGSTPAIFVSVRAALGAAALSYVVSKWASGKVSEWW